VETWRVAWQVPFGSFFVQLDALAAFFLLPILGLAAVAALYGGKYLMAYRSRKNLGAAWFFFNLLVASMVMVTLAQNGILFLLAWEIMSLASYFLVTFEDEKESVRQAGWTYLVATHLGTAFLLVLFLVLGRQAGSLDFERFLTASPAISPVAGVAFLLALIGFGTKAGFMPLHVWLPEPHPVAPSHVSALMSGVMIKTGIYGLLRILTFLGHPEAWWGWVLIGIGLASGPGGVLFALAQHDLKRLLAYHSVENIGIIDLGLGVGLLGLALDQPVLAVLGLDSGLLHFLNHALFKGMLFLGTGAAIHATGTRDIDHLGGLIRRMPWLR
jgi:hydrogenase-4 component B